MLGLLRVPPASSLASNRDFRAVPDVGDFDRAQRPECLISLHGQVLFVGKAHSEKGNFGIDREGVAQTLVNAQAGQLRRVAAFRATRTELPARTFL